MASIVKFEETLQEEGSFQSSHPPRKSSCNYLLFRLFRTVLEDPPAFLFLVSLVALSLCTPILGVYLKNSDHIPDLDTMKVWNSFLGKLPQEEFCVGGVYDNTSFINNPCGKTCNTTGVKLEFLVDKQILHDRSIITLAGDMSGKLLKIKKRVGGKRIDENITIHINLNVNETENSCNSSHCTVKGCVLITAPADANGFHEIMNPSPESRKPCKECTYQKSQVQYNHNSHVQSIVLSRKCQTVVKLAKVKYRRHGLIVIYISKEDQEIAAQRLYKSTVVFVGLALAFIIGLSCTDNKQSLSENHSLHNEYQHND